MPLGNGLVESAKESQNGKCCGTSDTDQRALSGANVSSRTILLLHSLLCVYS